MTVDVLELLGSGQMSLASAEAEYDRVMDPGEGADPRTALCMSRAEWTAFAQGVWFDELARWRKKGWPEECQRCGRKIAVDTFGWLAKEMDSEHRLVHVRCPT